MPTVVYRVEFRGRRKKRKFHHDSDSWTDLIEDEYKGKGGVIKIPHDQFITRTVVPDITFRLHGRSLFRVERLPRPAGIVLLLESPHRQEYFVRHEAGVFCPLEPLTGQRWRLRYLWEVLDAVGKYWKTPSLADVDVTLCNPVPWQASLARILKTRKLVQDIRDRVWLELWRIGLVRHYLCERLHSYDPFLILNGCTNSLKPHVDKYLRRLGFEGMIAPTNHPSGWMKNEGLRLATKLADSWSDYGKERQDVCP